MANARVWTVLALGVFGAACSSSASKLTTDSNPAVEVSTGTIAVEPAPATRPARATPPDPIPPSVEVKRDGAIVGLAGWQTYNGGRFASQVVVIDTAGAATVLIPPSPVSAIVALPYPGVARLRLRQFEFGGPEAVLDISTGRFRMIGEQVTTPYDGASIDSPSVSAFMAEVRTGSTRTSVLFDLKAWTVQDVPKCRNFVISPDGQWLADLPKATGGCTLASAQPFTVRRLDGTAATITIEQPDKSQPVEFKIDSFAPGSHWLILSVDSATYVADLRNGVLKPFGSGGSVVGWINPSLALMTDGERLEFADPLTLDRRLLRALPRFGEPNRWCIAGAEPSTIVELQSSSTGWELRFIDLTGEVLAEQKLTTSDDEACKRPGFTRDWSNLIWNAGKRGLSVYAIDPKQKRITTFASIRGKYTWQRPTVGLNGLAAIATTDADERTRTWLLNTKSGEAIDVGNGGDPEFSPSGLALLVDNTSATEPGTDVYDIVQGKPVFRRTFPGLTQATWLRA